MMKYGMEKLYLFYYLFLLQIKNIDLFIICRNYAGYYFVQYRKNEFPELSGNPKWATVGGSKLGLGLYLVQGITGLNP